MQAKAVAKYVRVSPRKARIVVDKIRGKEVVDALDILRFNERAAAELLEQACALMAQAKSCHDELETYYRTAVDFAQVDAAAAQCMELFGVG